MKKEKKASLIKMKHNEIKKNELKKISGGSSPSVNCGCICVCIEGLESAYAPAEIDNSQWYYEYHN